MIWNQLKMNQRPIRPHAEQVKAILAGRQSRISIPVKPQQNQHHWQKMNDYKSGVHLSITTKGLYAFFYHSIPGHYTCDLKIKSPYEIGDILWVKETYCYDNDETILYKADFSEDHIVHKIRTWKPSIHLLKHDARIWLEVTDIKPERLQDITEEDAIAEGVEQATSYESGAGISNKQLYNNYLKNGYTEVPAIDSFSSLYQSIHGPESWERNDWVWAVKFKVLSTTGKPEHLK